MAKEYVSRDTFEYDMGKVIKALEKLEVKIDRLFEQESNK
jgi:hypothetical protein